MSRAYEKIAEQLLAMRDEAGNWKPCWHRTGMKTPHNAVSKHVYRGANVLSLWCTNFETQRWATYMQWTSVGAQVRKGERGTPIIFWKTGERETEDGDTKRTLLVRGSTVFNVAQVDGAPPPPDMPANPDDRCALADAFAKATRASIAHLEGDSQPRYEPGPDRVVMPPFDTFHHAQGYYGVLLHELTHWSGHKDRCDRKLLNAYGSKDYAAEELVAELGAAFLCADLGIEAEPRADHASYLASWHKTLKNDVPAFMRAVGLASTAAQYLHALQLQEAA